MPAVKAAGVTLWSWNVDTDTLAMDDHAYDLLGIKHGTDVCLEDLSAHIHPADRHRARASFTATRAIVGAFEIAFRIMASDELKWVSVPGEGEGAGMFSSTVSGVFLKVSGVFLDVTGRKQAKEGNARVRTDRDAGSQPQEAYGQVTGPG